jgi:glycosyltransferase involved in cell wall biosynthesis/CDP-glycerol glycerophosphotransferase (TagB/SpsB family)
MKEQTFFINLIIDILAIQSINCYLFSVIISIYNTEHYLVDSINSIINQSIGFNNIQLILVNDGSIDNSEQICLKYKKKYQNNIIYIKIAHGGPSKARNIGLSYAKGAIINFLDSDDKWDIKAFNNVFLFFKLYKNIDVIGGRLKYFEASNKFHFLDYKFFKTRIVNLDKEYQCIQLHASSSFFRHKAIIRHKFDENLFFGEDVKFISNILLYKPIIGILREAIYYYRKRADYSSAIQNFHKTYNYYFQVLENIHLYLINKSKELYNKIIPFIQFYISYDFLFRISGLAYKYLDMNSYKKYCNLIKSIFDEIDEKYILEQKILSSDIKLLALTIKNSRDIRYDLTVKNNFLIYSNSLLMNINNYRNIIVWKILKIERNKLYLKGEERFFLPREHYFYYCKIGKKIFYPKYYYYDDLDFKALYGIIHKGRIISFDISLEIKRNEKLYFYIVYNNNIIEIFPKISRSIHIPMANKSYYSTNNYIIKNENNYLLIYKNESNLGRIFENDYQNELKKMNKDYLIKIRQAYIQEKERNSFKNKNQIWLINDRKNQAGDNGEYFFRYLLSVKPKGILFYFIIEKNSLDYIRLEKYGNIIDLNSTRYLDLFLKADKIITSVSEGWVNNAFGKDGNYLNDLYHFEYIYLQSDIINDYFSNNINKIKFNFDMIFTSSTKQYNFLLKTQNDYNINHILLNGLARFDKLKRIKSQNEAKKIILIYPTWGIYLKDNTNFTNFTYYKFYNNLTNDKNLLNIMKENDYKGILCVNSNFQMRNDTFEINQIFKIKELCNLEKLFIKSSLFITDYSNLFLDFGYMNKPIIYSQFDYKEYKTNYFHERNFDYESDGFGPVCYDLKCIIRNIILIIKNKEASRSKYNKRIKRFFRYSYEQNCKRIYLNIIKNRNEINYLSMRINIIIINFFIYFISIIKLYIYIKFYLY